MTSKKEILAMAKECDLLTGNGSPYFAEQPKLFAFFALAYAAGQQEIDSLRQQLAECERELRLSNIHREANYQATVQLGKELSTVTQQRDELVGALKQFAECDLNDDSCASLEVATRRIRSLAQATLAKLGADKAGEKR